MDIAGNFSEQFSDSSSNHGDLARIQKNSNATRSPCAEETTPSFSKKESCSKEGDVDSTGNSNGSSSALSPTSSKKALAKQSIALSKTKMSLCLSSSSLIRDENEIKKDDSISPRDISPIGFTSAVDQQSVRDTDDSNGVNRTVNRSPSSSDKCITFSRSGCNEIEERSANTTSHANPANVTSNIETVCSSTLGTSVSPKSKTEADLTSFNGNLAKCNSSTSGGDMGLPLNSSGGNSGSDYMQQQNHVFVFSTQLANKSAEAVLCGQFPTIIAYHCMQPTTKLFLEDFLKNPEKTTKLQRQYSLKIMNAMQSGLSVPDGVQTPYWLNECNNIGRLPSQRLPLRNVGVSVLGKHNNSRDPASIVENQTRAPPSTLGALNNAEAEDKSDDKSNIPSLQGVKVPDENLTPQQRQHREEQLAKLKKMNKFLFPENEGNNFQGPPPHSGSSSTADNVGNSGDMVHNPAGLCSDGISNKVCPNTMRSISGNLAKSVSQNFDTIPGMSVSDSIMPKDIISSSNDMPNIGIKFGGYMSKMNSSNISNVNTLKSRHCDMDNDQTGMENSPDNTSVGSFIKKNCPTSEAESICNGRSDMAKSKSEWIKFHNSTFQDGFKGQRQERVGNHTNHTGLSAASQGFQQNSALSRSLSTVITSYGSMQSRPNTGPNPNNCNNNGPPPPYHQTPRSASVPIAAESPTNTSPIKLPADMPLPSSQSSSRVQFGVSSTQPKAENSNPTSSTCSTYGGSTSGNVNSTAQVNPHNNSILNNMATNSPGSLSRTLPRENDCLDPGGQKSKMGSSHKFKSGSGMMSDLPDMDAKYSHFGMGYPTCNIPSQNMRHNKQQIPPQFFRRIDNIPLNPNCNRVGQNKNVTNFDPISSLTQMSQQLTGVGLSTIGGTVNVSGGLGVLDINQGELISGATSMRGSGDPSLDHCNQLSNINNMAMVGGLTGALGRVTGQFAPELNNMLCGDTGPIDQRMLNGKMCVPNMTGSFGSNSVLTGVGLRESAMGCKDMSSSNRTTNRRGIAGNFENFSMSPNIHVKASAPNTIQYMPARSQNMNMRVPPSVEFFQRYSNSQLMENMGGAVGHPSRGQMTNDISNPHVMNMFGNCTQIPTDVGQLIGGGNRGFEQNDVVEGNILSNNEYMNVTQ